jgi:ribulose-phosphate 3-epimerase
LKIVEIKSIRPELLVQVDGGVTLENLPSLLEAGADIFVAGTLIFGAEDPEKMIQNIKDIIARG